MSNAYRLFVSLLLIYNVAPGLAQADELHEPQRGQTHVSGSRVKTAEAVLKHSLEFEPQQDLHPENEKPRLIEGSLQLSIDLLRHRPP